MFGEWTETDCNINYAISTTWEMKSRTRHQKTSRLFTGPDQVKRPKTLQAI